MFRSLPCCVSLIAFGACGGSFGEPPANGDSDGGARSNDAGGDLLDFAPSNVPASHLEVGTASVVIDGDVTINSETGEIVGPGLADGEPPGNIFVVVEQSEAGAPPLGVFSWATLTVQAGSTISVEGQNALVFAISENASIQGVIEASGGLALAGIPGPGGFLGGNDLSIAGAGPGGGLSVNNVDAGGGGGGHGATGGQGGLHGNDPGGAGGAISGTSQNVPLIGGSGGARGGEDDGGGLGGGGGGAIQISARGELRIGANGGINVSGAGGLGGDDDRGGGGGGAGGAILLEARSVIVEGTLATNGGGGGAGANNNNKGADGMRGGFGELPASGGVGDGEGTDGGAGAAADVVAGLAGVEGNGNTGGGGGASGRVFVRSQESSVLGTVSPADSVTVDSL